jgi:ABC transporter with metal-binding/Fe-S-binding domain ATP-binding protein
MKTEKLALLFSGGKDSTFSLWYCLNQGWDVVTLVTVKPMNPFSWMFHCPCIEFTYLQAEALNLPLIVIKTKGKKEVELDDLKKGLSNLKKRCYISGVVSGAVASDYQKTRIDRICDRLNLKSFSPLWHKDPELLLRSMLDAGFEAVFTGVSAQGLNEKWLGRKLDEKAIEDLIKLNQKFGIHLSLEGGEAETFVIDCPLFKKRIEFEEVENVWKHDSGYILVKKAKLIDKV